MVALKEVVALQQQCNLASALDRFNDALRMELEFAVPYGHLGGLFLPMGLSGRAIKDFDWAVALRSEGEALNGAVEELKAKHLHAPQPLHSLRDGRMG